MASMSAPKPKTKRDGLYVHPKGSITKPTKVSCVSCISGHRSGACDHYDRILLKIRAAGRPSTTCHHQSSCGGACLEQKAFYIEGENPQWCREHRSCVENWAHPDRCPPYPVSTTKSAKRKERSNSPQVPDSTLPTREAGSSRAVSNGTKLSIPASTCAAEHGKIDDLPSLLSATPIYNKACSSMPWLPVDIDYSFHESGPFSPAIQPSVPHPMTPLSAPPTSFAEASTLNSLGASFDAPFSQDDHEPWQPIETFLPNFSFAPPEPIHSLTSAPLRNPFSTLPGTTSGPDSYSPTAMAPLRQRSSPRQTKPQQSHPCPGNGFQCPCDENCMCQDCYTHGRGFWTLPFSFSELPQEEYNPPPSHIMMPPSTFPESFQTHIYSNSESSIKGNSGLLEEDEDESKDKVSTSLTEDRFYKFWPS